MQFTAQLDVDVVALEAEDEVTCLVSLTAPVPDAIADRPGETLIAVVDRSGRVRGCRRRQAPQRVFPFHRQV